MAVPVFPPSPPAGKAGDLEAGLAGEASEASSQDGLEGGKASLARSTSDAAALLEAEHPRAPFTFQTAVLSVRMLRNWGRNPMMLAAEAVQVGGGRVWVWHLWRPAWLRGCRREAPPCLALGGRTPAVPAVVRSKRRCAWGVAANPTQPQPHPTPPSLLQYIFLAIFVGLVYLQ